MKLAPPNERGKKSFRREKNFRRESGEKHKSRVAVRTKQAQRKGAVAGVNPHRLPGKMRPEKQQAALRRRARAGGKQGRFDTHDRERVEKSHPQSNAATESARGR